MELFGQDTELNISPAYLRPGFAFGGSCLPKDLRALLHLARVNNVDLPLLAGTLATNELIVRDVVDRVVAGRGRTSRAARPELQARDRRPAREPERRAGRDADRQGLNVRIYDPIVNPARLVGANLRLRRGPSCRTCSGCWPTTRPRPCAVPTSRIVVVDRPAAVDAAARRAAAAALIDLDRPARPEAVEALPGYEGVGW